ncbi:MAG: oligosaccharide flippase family protein [Dermatophilaceae bacterium]
MVTAVIGFADIVRDLGLSTAAVRTVDLTPAQRADLFWLNTRIGGLLTLLVMALAPVLASVYGRPEIVGITLLLALAS